MVKCYSDKCDIYLINTNILVSLLLEGKRARKCLRECKAHYFVPRPAVDELLELIHSGDFQDIVTRIERRIDRGVLTIRDLLRGRFELLILLLESSVELVDVEPDHEAIAEAESIIGRRDPDDIPIVAIGIHISKQSNKKVCIWTNDKDLLDEIEEKQQYIKAVQQPYCCTIHK